MEGRGGWGRKRGEGREGREWEEGRQGREGKMLGQQSCLPFLSSSLRAMIFLSHSSLTILSSACRQITLNTNNIILSPPVNKLQ